ncbi:TorD/DmsD family molecular chaperone [Vibrio nereis]|uniref:Cytochrome C oxidase subunit II n=1 Tax=Vibrio nereis TaxID=693 RepID=A0A0M0HN03_VIBNE|nr:molecular chaperone TorD family protein [Vibrio nereis]KOO03444.1 cytochrome C oxidase subunit II [Vibrio nereis]
MDNQEQTLRAEIYYLLSTLYRQCPDKELLEFLSGLETESAPSDMQKAWLDLIEAAKKADLEALEDEYQDLFIGIGRGEVIPFASWHRTGSLMEKPLAAIRHDLELLGLTREDEVKEPEDHIAALCEVMALISSEDDELQQVFFNEHIATWFTAFVEQIKQAEHAKFYLAVANFAHAFLTLEQVRFSENIHSSKSKIKIDVKNITEYDQSQQ